MAIDAKFVTAGLTDGVVNQVNKKRERSRKRPKPWDPPTFINKSEENDDRTETPKIDLEKTLIPPTQDIEIDKKPLKTQPDDFRNEKFSKSNQKSKNNASTVRVQSKDSMGTEQVQSKDSIDTVRVQSKDSIDTVRVQSKDSMGTEQVQSKDSIDTVRVQSRDSIGTVQVQSKDSMGTEQVQSRDSASIKRVQSKDSIETKVGTVQVQSKDSKIANKVSIDESYDLIKALSNSRWELIQFLCNECLNNSTNIINNITYSYIANTLNKPLNTVKKVFQRIKMLNIIDIESFSRGPGSTVNIIVYDNTIKAFSKCIIDKSNYQKIKVQSGYSLQTNKGTVASSSSSVNLIEKDSTTKDISTYNLEDLPSDWLEIIIPQNVKEVRFGKSHLLQIYKRQLLNAIDVQDSLDHFSYDLENDYIKTYTGPLNMLMGVLIKQGSPYVSEKLVSEMREENEKNRKLLEEYRNERKQIAQTALTDKFEEYYKKLNQTDINKIAPPNNLAKEGSDIQKRIVKAIFCEKNGEI
ncbi:MAG: hypothetical protein HON90_17955 [Halobacteriovoraceae bacterium]|jgi:hypothetical protein|nr:hypothetical protein [Halobacteriovoraceae bacterium]